MSDAAALLPPWALQPIAVLDTETTGLAPEQGDRVIEIAVITFDQGVPTGTWATLLDPGTPLHPDVTRITGITDADVRGQPVFADVAAKLHEVLSGKLLCAYNVPFDRSFLVHEFARVGSGLPQGAIWLDPLVFAKQMQRGQGNMKLGTVAKRLGIPLDEAHRASADATCAGNVLMALSRMLPTTLEETLDLQEKWQAEQEAERASWKNRPGSKGGRPGQRGADGQLGGLDDAGKSAAPAFARNALGPGYPHGDELDPVRYLYLRAAGRL